MMGACTAAQVGVAKGILTAEQETALIDATAESLRSTYADLLAQLQLPPEERLTAANCPRLIERFKPQGVEIRASTQAEFRDFMAKEEVRWSKLIRERSIKAE